MSCSSKIHPETNPHIEVVVEIFGAHLKSATRLSLAAKHKQTHVPERLLVTSHISNLAPQCDMIRQRRARNGIRIGLGFHGRLSRS